MEKFVGYVNGKSFDNKEDFEKAAAEAVKNNDGTLSISSYVSYTNDDEEKDNTPVIENKNNLKFEEYSSKNMEMITKSNGDYEFVLPDELANKIVNAGNKKFISNISNEIIADYHNKINRRNENAKDYEKKLKQIQDRIQFNDEKIKTYKAIIDYYKKIEGLISTPSDDKEAEVIEEKNPVVQKKGTALVVDLGNFFSFLNNLDFSKK